MLKLSDLIGDDEFVEEVKKLKFDSLPVSKPKDNGWKIKENPNRMTRVFKINDLTKFNLFVMDLLEHQAETHHHGRMTIQFPKIKIDIWTKELNDITDIDIEWCDSVNDIFGGYNGK